VRLNLTESGLHPYALKDILREDELDALVQLPLGYGQTNGDPALRQQIASFYPGLDADNVLVTNGSAEANFALIWSLIEARDDVSMMLPNYMLVAGLLKSFGANVSPFHLQEERGWLPDLRELERGLTPRTRLIVVCNPNNPTGAVLDRRVMEEIVTLAKRSNA